MGFNSGFKGLKTITDSSRGLVWSTTHRNPLRSYNLLLLE